MSDKVESVPKAPRRETWEFRKTVVDRVVENLCTPYYKPVNKQWEITFRALGWNRDLVQSFWTIFYRINQSHSGEITSFEFCNYFNLDRSEYVEKCFEYFDTTGGDSIDFLEFIVSVWNICTMKIDTLTNFTFVRIDLIIRTDFFLFMFSKTYEFLLEGHI